MSPPSTWSNACAAAGSRLSSSAHGDTLVADMSIENIGARTAVTTASGSLSLSVASRSASARSGPSRAGGSAYVSAGGASTSLSPDASSSATPLGAGAAAVASPVLPVGLSEGFVGSCMAAP